MSCAFCKVNSVSNIGVFPVMYITVLERTDFENPIFSIISSQNCFIEMDSLGHERNVIYSKLVDNPFKDNYIKVKKTLK